MTQLLIESPSLQKANFQLRDYQKQAIAQTYRLIRCGVRSILVVAPTGCGQNPLVDAIAKTAPFAHLTSQTFKRRFQE